MLAIKIWNYFRGYVIIRVEGLTLEKFLNLALNKDIYLWDIERIEYTVIEGKVSLEGFKALREVVKTVGCRVYIIDKKGFPFLLEKIRKRKMFGIGFIIFIALIIFLSSFIWSIEILGNEKIKDEEIIKFLNSIDVSSGKMKYNIDFENIKNKIFDEFDEFSFVSVEMRGTKLFINVKEQELPPEKIDTKTPCNIVAKKKGVIKKVIARNGKSIVEEGQVVEKGQVLITGIIKDESMEENILVHSDGEVLAITRYAYTMEEAIEKEIKEETGEVYIRKELKFGEKGIQIIEGEIPFKEYIVVEDTKNIVDFLPIQIVSYEYREVEVKKIKQNIDSLKRSTQVLAVQEINKILPKDSQVISKDVKYNIEDNKLITQVIIEAIEDIGEKQIIYNRED